MKKKSFLSIAFSMAAAFFFLGFTACGNNSAKTAEEEDTPDEATFLANQPLESGLYDADYYDITGKNPRKGHFDGRIYFGLTPKTSAINVFENGNRTKIDYTVVLKQSFEKTDSGTYCAIDMKDNPVVVIPDTTYCLKFIHFNDTVQIGFSPKPRSTASGLEILEKIKERKEKK